MAPVWLPPSGSFVWVGVGVEVGVEVGVRTGLETITRGVLMLVVESVLLRLNVLNCLGASSGSPTPQPRQKHTEVQDERADLRPASIAMVSLKIWFGRLLEGVCGV